MMLLNYIESGATTELNISLCKRQNIHVCSEHYDFFLVKVHKTLLSVHALFVDCFLQRLTKS